MFDVTAVEPLDDFRVAMREKLTPPGVKRGHCSHIGLVEQHLRRTNILAYPLWVCRLADDDGPHFENHRQNDLSNGCVVFGSNAGEHCVAEKPVSALGKWRPGFRQNA